MTKAKSVRMPAGIRNKLMASVSMLLVASIMMVSSTYAWFTLSTAPEVTGISTSVGANGNLEIALLNGADTYSTETDTWADMAKIKSNVGDSSAKQAVTAANITWGNLVDLSDASYGTGSFVLNPARLNASANSEALKVTGAGLLTATYGADGRVSDVIANTVTGTYDAAKASFVEGNHGVRGIGVAAAMSEGTLALRNATAQVTSLTAAAKNGVQNALSANGSKLASLAIKFQDNENYDPTQDELAAVNAIITSISTAKANVKQAIQYAAMAYALSTTALTEDNTASVTSLDTYDFTKQENPATLPTELSTVKAAYEAITVPAEATNAATTKTAVGAIMDTTNATINSVKISEARTDAAVSELANKVLSDGGLKVVVPADSTCALAKVAAACGNISSNIVIESLSAGGVNLTNVKASLSTSAESPFTMVAAGTLVSSLTAKDNETGTTDNLITDLYGYAIDFAFRTNAASSNLLLQVDGAQRIYSDGNDLSTQGAGSYMEFTKGDLSNSQFKKLLDAVRVVFTDGEGKVLTIATLDTTHKTNDTDDTETFWADKNGENDNTPVASFKAPLVLHTVSAVEETKGELSAKADQVIMPLTQNEPAKLTVMVYLDGDTVDNSAVSATSARSMTGTMNLQFASSATLVPMDYTPLHSVDATTPTTPTEP